MFRHYLFFYFLSYNLMMNTVKILERGNKTVYQIVNTETKEVVFEVYLHDDAEQITWEYNMLNQMDIFFTVFCI